MNINILINLTMNSSIAHLIVSITFLTSLCVFLSGLITYGRTNTNLLNKIII